jgi:hypothetical protein
MAKQLRNEMLNLIAEYIRVAQYCFKILRDKIPTGFPILGAHRQKIIPKTGIIGNLKYNFHGVGCYFEFDDGTELNIDFGPDDRCDGFDLYRLWFFMEHMKGRSAFSSLNDESKFKMEFANLIRDNIIYNPQWVPSPHLYYLSINPILEMQTLINTDT